MTASLTDTLTATAYGSPPIAEDALTEDELIDWMRDHAVEALVVVAQIRSEAQAIEALAGRRQSERPYMSPEERLARIEERTDAILALTGDTEEAT